MMVQTHKIVSVFCLEASVFPVCLVVAYATSLFTHLHNEVGLYPVVFLRE